MRISKTGEPINPFEPLADGVLGYAVEHEGAVYLPDIRAAREGRGDVGRFLDSLDKAKTWKVPNVISARLAGMLERRGWKKTVEHDPVLGPVGVFVREGAR